MTQLVSVRTASRIHFGMFSLGHSNRPAFGGVGVMVSPPSVKISLRPAQRFSVAGLLSNRVEQVVRTATAVWRLDGLPECELRVEQVPPGHSGLGVGTQLGLAVVTGLRKFLGMADMNAVDLARSAGRGGRSAVGTYGFLEGGLIVDGGKREGQPLGTLLRRVELPTAWRFVLIRSRHTSGLAGAGEAQAFDQLPPVTEEVTLQLRTIALEAMLPAVARADCAAFGHSVYEFGRLAGNCFTPVQGGPFASDEIQSMVETIREHGVPGVGQSSWGPTVFAIAVSRLEASELADWLADRYDPRLYEISVASPNNHGATVEVAAAVR